MGGPLPTVETEVNGDSKSTNERGPSLVGSLGSSCRCKRLFPAFAALVSPVQNILFLTAHYFNLCVSIAQQPGQGSRAGPPISECVSPIAHTKGGRAQVIKAAHRTGLLWTSKFKVIFMYTRYCIIAYLSTL